MRLASLASLLLSIGCAPQPADRATLGPAGMGPADARPRDIAEGPDGPAPAALDGGMVLPDASTGAASDLPLSRDTPPLDRALPADRSPDQSPDSSAAQDAPPPRPMDAAADLPANVTVLLVVGTPGALSIGDNRIRTAIAAKGHSVRIVDDDAGADVTGASLVLLTSTTASVVLAEKYRDVRVPVIVAEPSVFDALGMTGTTATDLGETVGESLTILVPDHVMAGGLSGTVTVVSPASMLGWGRPPAGAERIATVQGQPNQAAIFGYPAGAMMATGPAPARRVAFFATNNAATNFADNGLRLLSAAIDWALLP